MGKIEYLRGPLGWSVVHNGKPVGSIKRSSIGVFLVSVEGFRPGQSGRANRGANIFPSLGSAKTAVKEVLCREAK